MKTYQQIYPEDCNPVMLHGKFMCHGPTLLKWADRTAALHCKDLLKNTGLFGLTVGVDKVQFHRGPICGEVMAIESKVHSYGDRRITFNIEIKDEQNKLVLNGLFAFCSFILDREDNPSIRKHGLK